MTEIIQLNKKVKRFTVRLTLVEMQTLANALTAFFNVMNERKTSPSPVIAERLFSVLNRCKAAAEGNDYKIEEEIIKP
jgi:hypothetical protein